MIKQKKKVESVSDEQDVLTSHALRIQDLFAPDGFVEKYDQLFLGGRYVRSYLVHGLPRRVQVGWLDELFNAGEVDVSVHIIPASERSVVQTLIAKETRAQSQLILDQQSGNISRMPELEQQVVDYKSLRDAVQLGQDRLYYLTIFITVYGASEEEHHRRCETVETVLARRGVIPRKAMLRQVHGLKGTLPLLSNSFGKEFLRNMTSGAAACCLPLSISGGGHSSGVMLGVNLFSKAPVFLDRFAGEHVIPNQHLYISGETGSGKSVSLRELALLEGYRRVKTAFVDPEGEYVYFVRKLGGQVVHLRPGKFSGINPLEIEPELDDDDNLWVNLLAKVEDARAIVGSVYRYHQREGLDVVESALLEEAVKEEYLERGITEDPLSLYEGGVKKAMPALSSVHERLLKKPNAQRLADGMKPLLSGGSVGMFDGQTTVHLEEAPFICFDLHALGSDFPRFVAVCAVLTWLWQTFAQKGGKEVPKSVAVDEAWMFLRHPDAAMYLETLARRGRKHGCGLTIATQRFEEFASSEAGRAVIESCATIMVLKQEDHAAQAVVEYFKLASGCADFLSQARPGQGILRVSGSTTAVQVQPAPFEWDAVETRVKGR